MRAVPKGAVGLGVLALDPRLREELARAARRLARRRPLGRPRPRDLGPGASAESYAADAARLQHEVGRRGADDLLSELVLC